MRHYDLSFISLKVVKSGDLCDTVSFSESVWTWNSMTNNNLVYKVEKTLNSLLTKILRLFFLQTHTCNDWHSSALIQDVWKYVHEINLVPLITFLWLIFTKLTDLSLWIERKMVTKFLFPVNCIACFTTKYRISVVRYRTLNLLKIRVEAALHQKN